ncbi:MAG: hypothetical protein R3B90_06790 [Planctomycetaceae bacterium]
MQFIGIDLGSTSIKGAVLNVESRSLGPVRSVACPPPRGGLPTGHFAIDPRQVMQVTRDLLDRLLDDVEECGGLLCCTQMGGVILAQPNGDPASDYLSWRDERTLQAGGGAGESSHGRLLTLLGEDVRAELGHECKPGSALSLLYWLREHGDLPDGLIPLSLGDLVLSQLCGSPPVCHPTTALGTLDVEHSCWHAEAIQRAGLSQLRWPQLAGRTFEPFGDFTHRGRGIPCYPAVGDHQAALLGTGLRLGELSVNVSTGSQVSRIVRAYRAGDYQVRPWFDGDWLSTLTHLPAGRSLNVLVDLLTELSRESGQVIADPWPIIARLAEAEAGGLEADLAFFAGPMGERGSIRNIGVTNLTVGSLFRAAFDNMADNYRRCADRLCPEGVEGRGVLSGGLVQRLPQLRRLIEAQLGIECRYSTCEEETLTGLLTLARVAAGLDGSVEAAART